MTLMRPITSIPGTRLSECYRAEKQLGTSAQAWRQRPAAFLGTDVSTTDNNIRASKVEYRHT